MKSHWILPVSLLTLLLMAPALTRGEHPPHAQPHAHPEDTGTLDTHPLVAVLIPLGDSGVAGTIRFESAGHDKVRVSGEVTGLNPGQQHGFHVHEFGDATSADGSSAGSHFNPEGHPHGLPDTEHRHAGDLGNLQADDQGVARYDAVIEELELFDHEGEGIVGRSIIIHAKPDDGSQPLGNAGARIAIGVIGFAKP